MKIPFTKKPQKTAFEKAISEMITPISKKPYVTLDALMTALTPVLTDTVIPGLRDGWEAAGSPECQDHGLKLPFSDVLSRIFSGNPTSHDREAFLTLAAMNANKNSMVVMNEDVFFWSSSIRKNLPRVLEDLMNGTLSETRHMHYTTSTYTGEMTTFAFSGFTQVIGKTPAVERPNRSAMDIKGTVQDLTGEILVVSALEGPMGGDLARKAYDCQVPDQGNINYGIVRERANVRSLVSLGIARVYVPQDETISVLRKHDGVKVFLGSVEGAETITTEGEVFIGSTASFERILDIQGMRQIDRYFDDLVELDAAIRMRTPATTEKTKARFLIDDTLLMRHDGGDEPVLIAAIGDFPMPAMGSLPADLPEPEEDRLGL